MKPDTLKELSKKFMDKVIDPLKEEYPIGYFHFAEPLRVVGFENNVLTLFHKDADWILEYYGARIKELLNEGIDEDKQIKIKIVNKR